MKTFDANAYLEAKDNSNTQKVEVEAIDKFILFLSTKGFCASRQTDSWRILNKPECPLRVQLEFTKNGKQSIAIIPLSSYTESLNELYPLQNSGIPHTVILDFVTDEDIDNAYHAIEKCFPAY